MDWVKNRIFANTKREKPVAYYRYKLYKLTLWLSFATFKWQTIEAMDGLGYHQSWYGLFLTLYCGAIFPLLYAVWTRRNHQPLLFRNILLIIVSTLGGAAMVFMICFREPDVEQFPCWLFLWTSLLFLALFFSPYILICLRVISAYEIRKSEQSFKPETQQDPTTVISKTVYKQTSKSKLTQWLIVILVVHILLGFVIWHILELDNEEEQARMMEEEFDSSHAFDTGVGTRDIKDLSSNTTPNLKTMWNEFQTLLSSLTHRFLTTKRAKTVTPSSFVRKLKGFYDGDGMDGLDVEDKTVFTLQQIGSYETYRTPVYVENVEKEILDVCAFDVSFLPFFTLSVIYILIFGILLRRIGNIDDVWNLSKELRSCFTVWLICAFFFYVFNLADPLFGEVFPPSNWILILICYTHVRTLLLPYIASYALVELPTTRNSQSFSGDSSDQTNEEITEDEQNYQAIVQMVEAGFNSYGYLLMYLREKCDESILDFVVEVTDYERIPTAAKATHLINFYVNDRFFLREKIFEFDAQQQCIEMHKLGNLRNELDKHTFSTLKKQAIMWIARRHYKLFLQSDYPNKN